MALDLTFINAALTRTGNEPVTSLDEDNPGAQIANENYEGFVEAEMSGYRWKWASKTATLALLEETAPDPWGYAYQRPSDLLLLRTIKSAGMNVDYEVEGSKILTDVSGDSEVVAHYTARFSESQWPAWFGELIIRRLEPMFLRGIGERFREAEAREKAAEQQYALAKRLDSQSQPGRTPFVSSTLAARRA